MRHCICCRRCALLDTPIWAAAGSLWQQRPLYGPRLLLRARAAPMRALRQHLPASPGGRQGAGDEAPGGGGGGEIVQFVFEGAVVSADR